MGIFYENFTKTFYVFQNLSAVVQVEVMSGKETARTIYTEWGQGPQPMITERPLVGEGQLKGH